MNALATALMPPEQDSAALPLEGSPTVTGPAAHADRRAARSRHQERSERSTRRLLAAVSELIVEGGYPALILAAIGARAGYTRGLVSARFGSKEKLLEALIDLSTTRWIDRKFSPQAVGKPRRERPIVLLDAVRTQANRHPSALWAFYVLLFEAVRPIPALGERNGALRRQLRSQITELLRSGIEDVSVSPAVAAEREAEVVVATLRGFSDEWALDPDGFDPVASPRHFIEITDAQLRAVSTDHN